MNYNYQPPSRSQRKQVPIQFGTHIFYAEGKKTEPKYVENMKKIIKTRYHMNPKSDIIIVDEKSGGRNTLSLVQYAEADVKARRKKGQEIDHVWIFYDKDSFNKDDYDNAYHKIVSKNKKNHLNSDGDATDKNLTRWHALWSNECFELWVLLHFQYSEAALSRKTYIPNIDDLLKKMGCHTPYEKNLDTLFEMLLTYGNIKNAVKWAKMLNDNSTHSKVKSNPSTGIHELIEYFQFYLKLDL
ncbi:RloB family protein [Acholeplasma laidlawii]|uniref:RloB family protein n=1 Tax=Acholeplasma laidlawii TaxID=2148 RepID=UPI003F8F42AC